jgi:hypothetical protein
MADSDNITTLSLVTRRRLLSGASVLATGWRLATFSHEHREKARPGDPAVVIWHEWQVVHQETQRLCREQQKLERKVIEAAGRPLASNGLSECSNTGNPSVRDIHESLRLHSRYMATGATIEVDQASYQAYRDITHDELNYSAAQQAEHEMGRREENLLELLSSTPATSIAGVIAKLDAILIEGQPSKDDAEFPWPQIRSVLQDIVRLGHRAALR